MKSKNYSNKIVSDYIINQMQNIVNNKNKIYEVPHLSI